MKISCKKYISCFVFLILLSCSKSVIEEQKISDNEFSINLKWNKAYTDDTFERNRIALDWFLSYLGARNNFTEVHNEGVLYNTPFIVLKVDKLGFNSEALIVFKRIHNEIKKTEEYLTKGAIDLARYITLILGDSRTYFDITGVPRSLDILKDRYTLQDSLGYVNNSSVSITHRLISYSNYENNGQFFLAAEIDSITGEPLEFESLEILGNGQLVFGIFDKNGQLKEAANPQFTMAGKPGKCMWCHEVNIQPLITPQQNLEGYLNYESFKELLRESNRKLQEFQNEIWENESLKNKQNHIFMEIAYISYLEPSLERLSNEWNMSVQEVQEKLRNLETHEHDEFDFLGNLYTREEVQEFAPYESIVTPNSVREIDN
ncbi:hypothetical protein [Tenacibaculum xiamenense]|uniref:hypothetical protein n=1 Tax=Tenacibaculum xiamenense TaxID=1261553 RepID=UPI003893BBA7